MLRLAKGDAMKRNCCMQCIYFNNSPQYLETVFKGMTSLSSAYGSVRKLDGICSLKDLYLSADGFCREWASKG